MSATPSADYDAWVCPSCGNDPADPSLHMEGCPLAPLTAQDWAALVEAIRPPTAWSDYGKAVTSHLLDEEDAEFAMRTLAPVVAGIAERWAAIAPEVVETGQDHRPGCGVPTGRTWACSCPVIASTEDAS